MGAARAAALPAALAVCALTACGSTGEAGGGSLELAVSAGCAPESASECVAVGAGRVLEPAGYEAAGVSSAEIVDGASIAIELDAAGEELLEELSREAASAEDGRLLIRAGEEIVAAPVVMDPMSDGRVLVTVGPEEDAERILSLIRGS